MILKPNHNIDIEPANVDQLIKAGEHWIRITDDVTGVAKELSEVDPHIHLRYNALQKFYAVYWRHDNGDEEIVSTYKQCDKRIVDRVRQIYHESYNFIEELEELEDKRLRDKKHEEEEFFGEMGERLANAIRRDLGIKDRIFT